MQQITAVDFLRFVQVKEQVARHNSQSHHPSMLTLFALGNVKSSSSIKEVETKKWCRTGGTEMDSFFNSKS